MNFNFNIIRIFRSDAGRQRSASPERVIKITGRLGLDGRGGRPYVDHAEGGGPQVARVSTESVLDDGGEGCGVEAGTADQSAVNFGFRH
jgi:hypothetical protein